MIRPTSHEEARGATFSEVMVAMALISLGVIGAMGAFEAADHNLGRDALAARALSMAQSRLEAKRAAPWSQLLADDLDHDGVMDVSMHDDGAGGDRLAGDGIYAAMYEEHGVTVVWTVAAAHAGSLITSGAVVIEARGVYRASGGEREVRLATLRANPVFAGSH
jgi:hypothetical protein